MRRKKFKKKKSKKKNNYNFFLKILKEKKILVNVVLVFGMITILNMILIAFSNNINLINNNIKNLQYQKNKLENVKNKLLIKKIELENKKRIVSIGKQQLGLIKKKKKKIMVLHIK